MNILTKPVSAKSLYDRLVAITLQPRPIMQMGDYYGPEPRKHVLEIEDDVGSWRPASPPIGCELHRRYLSRRRKML